jgi:hypothetical protein
MKRFTDLSGTGQAVYALIGIIVAAALFGAVNYIFKNYEQLYDSTNLFYRNMIITYTDKLPNVTCNQWIHLPRKDQRILASRYMSDSTNKADGALTLEASDGGSLIGAECLAYDWVTLDFEKNEKSVGQEPLSVAIPIGRKGLLNPQIRGEVIDEIHAIGN